MKLKNWHYVVIDVVVIVLLWVTGSLCPVLEILGLGLGAREGRVGAKHPGTARQGRCASPLLHLR